MFKGMRSCVFCLSLFSSLMVAGTLDSQAQTFGNAGPVDVNPGQITIIQIENGTPAADTMNYRLEIDPSVKSAIVMRATSDGRVSPLRLEDQVLLKINVKQAGTYYLFCNVSGADGSSDSFFVGIDDDIDNDNLFRNNINPANGQFHVQWVTSETLGNQKVDYNLTAGQHIINWNNREPNARLDWIGITDNPDLDLATVQEPGQPVSLITVERSGGSGFTKGAPTAITLKVTNPGTSPTNVTITETPPTGWTVSNISHNGTMSNSVITWTLNNLAPGTTHLTYNVTAPADFADYSADFAGTVKGNSIGDLSTGGALNIFINSGLGPQWVLGDGIYFVENGVLRAIALDNVDPKHAWVQLDLGPDWNYTVRCDIRMDTWENNADLSRAGICVRLRPDGTGGGGAGPTQDRAVNLLFHENTETLEFLNDLVGWANQDDNLYPWEPGQWYTFELIADGDFVEGSVIKKGDPETEKFEMTPWAIATPADRAEGYPGVTASTLGVSANAPEGMMASFDNFQVLKGGQVVFSDDFDTVQTSVPEWSLY